MLECLFLIYKKIIISKKHKKFPLLSLDKILTQHNQNERKMCLLNTKNVEFYMKSFPWRPFKASVNSCGHIVWWWVDVAIAAMHWSVKKNIRRTDCLQNFKNSTVSNFETLHLYIRISLSNFKFKQNKLDLDGYHNLNEWISNINKPTLIFW